MLASSFGIPPQVPSSAVTGLTQMFLHKLLRKSALGLMSALPKEVKDQFNDDDKQRLTTTRKPKSLRFIKKVVRNNKNKTYR